MGLAEDYVATGDRETLVGVTVETEASVGDIDEILDVPELWFVFIGPFDLSVSFGHPGELDHPDVQAAVETVRSRAVDAGVPVGGPGFGMEDVNEKAANGYGMLNLGSTTAALQGAVTDWLDAYEGERAGNERRSATTKRASRLLSVMTDWTESVRACIGGTGGRHTSSEAVIYVETRP